MRVLLLAFVLASLARAHPQGHFGLGQYARLELTPDGIRIEHVLEFGEALTLGLADLVGAPGAVSAARVEAYRVARVAEWARQVHLAVDGSEVELELVGGRSAVQPGVGGLSKIRMETRLAARWPPGTGAHRLEYRDDGFAEASAFRDVVLVSRDIRVDESTASSEDVTAALTRYPADGSPAKDVRTARVIFGIRSRTGTTPPLAATDPPRGVEPISRGLLRTALFLTVLLGFSMPARAHGMKRRVRARVAGMSFGTMIRHEHTFARREPAFAGRVHTFAGRVHTFAGRAGNTIAVGRRPRMPGTPAVLGPDRTRR